MASFFKLLQQLATVIKMRSYFFLIICIFLVMSTGCSVRSVIQKSIKTAYKTAVDERSIKHILNDKKLTLLIMEKIMEDDITNLLDVTAKCYFGYPFVIGQCSTLDEAERLVEIAREVTEKPVVPFLLKKEDIDDCNPAMDLKISTEITARLVSDKKIFATNIYVKSVQCTAVLLGVVGSEETIQAVMEHAKNTGGVLKVQSFLVSTGTNRSWESIFEAMAEMIPESEENSFQDIPRKTPE